MRNDARDIAARILSLDSGNPVRIAIDGFCGAGKTSFADYLAADFVENDA